MHRTLIIGNHPLANDLIRQYKERGGEVIHCLSVDDEGIRHTDCDEFVLLSDISHGSPVEADHAVMTLLAQIAGLIEDEGQKKTCHLLLRSNEMLQRLHALDFCETIQKKMNVYPFTMEEVWGRTVRLDREPITLESEKHVHLVVFGMSEMAETVAIQLALVAHYPNYIRDHSVRTRITLIDKGINQRSKEFLRRYRHLFDNSYYRMVNPEEKQMLSLFHKPMYERVREDFVDVEWEFVEASIDDVAVREKLQYWATDKKQLLTVVMAHPEGVQNVSEALLLPNAVYQQNIPVYVFTPQDVQMASSNMIPFGMQNRGYDITLPLVSMAKNVNYLYHRCYEDNIEHWNGEIRNAVDIDKTLRDALWEKLPNMKRMSCIYNAMTIATKMRSVGLEEDDWNRFYDISKPDIVTLAQVEHNRWNVEELILGWRPCTDEEQKAVEANIGMKNELKKQKIHYDLRAYHDLRPDETGKPVEIYDLCLCSSLPLIAKAYIEEKGGNV